MIVRQPKESGAKRVSSPTKRKGSQAPPPPPTTPTQITTTKDFYLDDFGRTLFPLKTNREIIIAGEAEVQEYIRKCLDPDEKAYAFSSQQRVFGAKPGAHLRRTVKLDVVAEYYLYDVVFRNRDRFRKPHSVGRTHYGYRFEKGVPIPASSAYKAFKGAVSDYSAKHSHLMSMDVASYFNTIYHHDIVSWFAEISAPDADVEGLGQFLREINSGRSLDCLPQGLFPAKMIGNDFLRFIDNFYGLRSDQVVRFMDDIYIFSDEEETLASDFQVVQRLLGQKGLSLNPAKTHRGTATHTKIDNDIDAAKASLLQRRRIAIVTGYDEDGDIVEEVLAKFPLSKSELEYITSILDKPEIEEEDAELLLTIMREQSARVEKKLPYLVSSFPNLAKSVHSFCAGVQDKQLIADIIISTCAESSRLMEFQLFWFGAILEDYLMDSGHAAAVLQVLFDHPSATTITKAKILETADARFGLQELRDEVLTSGQSNWLAWASAVGSRALKPTSRNHKLKYFGNFSNLNHLVSEVASRLPQPSRT